MVFDYSFDFGLAILLIIFTFSQSIFGVGLLLWGTPTLLLLGYSYPQALSVLLPISISISLFQTFEYRQKLCVSDMQKFVIFSLPVLLLSFIVALQIEIDFTLFVAFSLLLAGTLRLQYFKIFQEVVARQQDLLLPLIGLVHGVSNLGGPLLVVWATYRQSKKLEQRTLIAFSYTVLATFQLSILWLYGENINIHVVYTTLALFTYFLVKKYIFFKISEFNFESFLTILIFAMSVLLFIRNV